MDSITARFHREVFTPYLDLLKSRYRFHPVFSHVKTMWDSKLTARDLVNGPYLEKSQSYSEGSSLDSLALDQRTKAAIRKRIGNRPLWKHQTDALEQVLRGKNVVIATGTSSGKTLCYQIPILDDLLRDSSPGLRAIIIYPLNALVNDQLTEWEQMLGDHPEVTFARFTGQTPATQADYELLLKIRYREELADSALTQHELQKQVDKRVAQQLASEVRNRLNHREAIRARPPHVLITNFSMLEYLLERPVDASIFQNSRLRFLVLDEAHAYRGVQATEIAFLVRRIKDRLHVRQLVGIATSATLGKQGDRESQRKVQTFASNLFAETFEEPNPIYGTPAKPMLLEPAYQFTPDQYIHAAELLRKDSKADIRSHFAASTSTEGEASFLFHDANLYRLRNELLTRPTLLETAAKELWPNQPEANASEGLQALLEVIAVMRMRHNLEDLLPTRLHYFVRAQDGLHVCLHEQCPGRDEGHPAFFFSRCPDPRFPEGDCPECRQAGRRSKLVEVVTCRKCGYLFGALQDLGPRRAQQPEDSTDGKAYFDSFTTDLGWIGDSFWTYFSIDRDLPYPVRPQTEDDESEDLLTNPSELQWCLTCGKKRDLGAGDNCICEQPHTRTIKIFHRQCPHSGKAKDRENLLRQEKTLLTSCPNCGARNGSGLEPLHRFQESDDEMGLAMAIPLAHFSVSAVKTPDRPIRKLLCFTDHRQRAAAFPSLLEEETFAHDMGRIIVQEMDRQKTAIDLVTLGELLAAEEDRDPQFFLPVSRFPEGDIDARTRRNLWLAETFSYFGVPDSARESVEDFGLVAITYTLRSADATELNSILTPFGLRDKQAQALLQTLLSFVRQRKAFTLPKGRVSPDDPAFGRVTADISYVLRRKGIRNTNGWLPRENKDGSVTSDNLITDYLRRALQLTRPTAIALAEQLWNFLVTRSLLIENRYGWKLDHERLLVQKVENRYECPSCATVTSYSANNCCPRKGCIGKLQLREFDPSSENIIGRWVSGTGSPEFWTLKSEEHTAQINKDLAKSIEDQFRAEGVNLLSSTTTFEMGINIGDLQKVLLRNAPPSSASYVQRVGRAGRGSDKNSVSVTLCRRTKYDADAWNDPPRLMSGEVRTPTVFVKNKVIAQRHINAMLFAKFLRVKLLDERMLQTIGQQIRLEGFISPERRKGIPDAWFQLRPANTYLDYVDWLAHQREASLFTTEAGRSLLGSVQGYDGAIASSIQRYGAVLESIAEELTALLQERKKLYDIGAPTSDIEKAIRNLLGSDVISVLAKRGFLPRYAFPLDVVSLETGRTRWSSDKEVELSRDRGIAIAEFAPGAQVIAHKKVFTSAGLYVASKIDRPQRLFYSECPSCKQIRTATTANELIRPCTVCQKPLAGQHVRYFVEPAAFSIRVNDQEGSVRYRRSTLIRQRQSLTHFIDHVDDASFKVVDRFGLALMSNGALFRYNLGPENKGFMLCPECGYSESLRSFKASGSHERLRPFGGSKECTNDQPWTKPLAYGHQFSSYCLIVRPLPNVESVESLAYALQMGLCHALDLESFDIGVSWRWLSDKQQKPRSEIILYDNTPGGAGFVHDALEDWARVVKETIQLCTQCTCEQACYDCLKSYSNQAQHDRLLRQSVLQFFGH